jgi:predicted nucleotidyltransferase component of viral defense system
MTSFFDSPASLQKAAGLLGARRVDYVEIDVILTHLLQRMSEAGLMDHLVFKGGTMLRKMIFGQAGRLSTDLDFVVRSIDGIVADDMALEIASVFGEDYRGMTFKLDLRDVDRTDGACRANPRCMTKVTPAGHVIKIEVSYRADPILRPVVLPHQKQPYFAELGFEPAAIPCLQLEEAAAEKIRAAFQRPKIRDLHDLQQLRKQRFDPELVRRMAVLKVWESPEGRSFEPFAFDTFVRRMKQRIDDGRYDEGDLKGLLRRQDNVDLKRMVADVSETYAFLKNLTEDERVLATDQHKKEEGRYEVCRSAVREVDPVPAETVSTKPMGA